VQTKLFFCSLLFVILCGYPVFAQSASIEAPIDQPTIQETTLPELTVVQIEILEPLNSKTSKIGDFFAIRLSDPIITDGKIIVPAGVTGKGEVIHAAKARAAGKAGELILTARYLDFNDTKIPLRSFKYGASTGKNNASEAFAVGVGVAAPLVLFVSGGNVDIPAGTRAHAKTAVEITMKTTGENK
jgi:hypothetical protein